MPLPRFFAPSLDPGAIEVTLPGDESTHLTRVMRLGVGDEVAVFDGRGVEFRARVASVVRGVVRLALVAPIAAPPEPSVSLTLAQAVLKGDKMDDVVRDATMLGVAAIVPLTTTRTVLPRRAASAGVERWTRIAIASAKQCGRAVVPAISSPLSVAEWLDADTAATRLWLVEPSVDTPALDPRAIRELPPPATASLTVGPEGGWTTEEVVAARNRGCRCATLGRRTLRADAVGLVALAVVGFLWET